MRLREKMHSRPDRCPSEARRAEVASTRSEAQCTATEHRAAVRRERCEDKRSGKFVGKPKVCQRSEAFLEIYSAARRANMRPAWAMRRMCSGHSSLSMVFQMLNVSKLSVLS